ncbi:unnamed protein product [Sphenostylis stenocarpa]|uniref:Uncharacterized protein n=1 Tax=Sphenostylis stenocarpa TaxID=92480 RepID=A0AA86RYQ8_9FABA|nr:unnamed protein product [Sphenostylis stenocarpa]
MKVAITNLSSLRSSVPKFLTKFDNGIHLYEEKEWWSVKEMGDKHGWMAGVGVISECGKYRIAQAAHRHNATQDWQHSSSMQQSHSTRETEQNKFHSYNNLERGVSVLGSGGAFVSPCVSTTVIQFHCFRNR